MNDPLQATTPTPLVAAPALLQRRWVLGGAVALALGACSKKEPAPAPAAVPASGSEAVSPQQAFEAASKGTGFAVGPASAVSEMRVFFDPQCPHCAALWTASKPLHDRLRMVWMPVAFIAPTSEPQGALLLAAADPARTMDEHEALLASGKGGLAVGTVPDAGLVASVRLNTALWSSLKASSVPYALYRAGAVGPFGVLTGSLPSAELAQRLKL